VFSFLTVTCGIRARAWLVVLWMLTLPALVGAQSKIEISEVSVTGFGRDYAAATFDALESAVAQATGTHIASETSIQMRQQIKDGSSEIQEDFRQNIAKFTKGIVKSYQITEQGKDGNSGQLFVKLTAQIPRYEQSAQLKRLRLAVMPIAIKRALVSDPFAVQFAERVSAGTEAYLTQTRRFAMLDRRAGVAVDMEQSFIRNAEMPIEELVRTNAAVGTDYLVLAIVTDFSQSAESVTRPNGRQVERLLMPSTIDIRVIDVATRQIKFAQTFSHRGRLALGKNLQSHATDVSQEIGETILNAIYPIAVIAAEGPSMTLNQGGVTVKNGRRYKLVQLGAPMVDPYTKESLGRAELEVGVVEITGVTSQMSTAKLVSGSEEILAAGDLLLRPLPRSAASDDAGKGAQDTGATEKKKKAGEDW
jgi:curli biogenesis system outer membrane secretion channel CsgG